MKLTAFTTVWAFAGSTVTLADPLNLVALSKGGSLENGWYPWPTPSLSVSDGSNLVFMTGVYEENSGSNAVVWTRFINSNGMSTNLQTKVLENDNLFPRIAAMNGKIDKAVTVGYDEKDIFVQFVSPSDYEYDSYTLEREEEPLAIALLNNGDMAMINKDSTDLLIYRREYGSLTVHETLDVSMDTLKKMVYDAKADALFVGGNEDDERAVARIDFNGGSPSETWVSEVDTDKGTPILLLRRKNVESEATEVLLLSKRFYARIDASTGKQIYLREKNKLWQPEDNSAQAAYDPNRNVIYSTADARLRQNKVSNGKEVWEIELNKGVVKDKNPAHERSDYPPRCGVGAWAGVDPDHPGCLSGGNCSPYKDRYGNILSCNNSDTCCIYGSCCIDEWSFVENWYKYEGNGSPQTLAVHVTKNGRVHVDFFVSGGVDDEDSYCESWLATYWYV